MSYGKSVIMARITGNGTDLRFALSTFLGTLGVDTEIRVNRR